MHPYDQKYLKENIFLYESQDAVRARFDNKLILWIVLKLVSKKLIDWAA